MEALGVFGIMGVILREEITNYFRSWVSYCQRKKFEWREQRDPATGAWSPIRIIRRDKPWNPGAGVAFETMDQRGEVHMQYHCWSLWMKNKGNRRALSRAQEKDIQEGYWPSRSDLLGPNTSATEPLVPIE